MTGDLVTKVHSVLTSAEYNWTSREKNIEMILALLADEYNRGYSEGFAKAYYSHSPSPSYALVFKEYRYN
jgi:hypothetical protein